MLSGPGAPADVTALAAAAHPTTPGASAAPAPSARPPRVLIPSMRACVICGQRHLDRDCPSKAAAAYTAAIFTARSATSGAAATPAAAAAAAHAATDATARPATPGAAAAAAAHAAAAATGTAAAPAPWLPTGDAAPNAPLLAAAAVERRDAHVARNYEEAVERRDAHVAQTYDALSSDGSEYAPHPRQRAAHHGPHRH